MESIGKYVVKRKFAEGSYSTLYEVVDNKNYKYTLKLFDIESNNLNLLKLLDNEIKVLKYISNYDDDKICNPNLLCLKDIMHVSNRYYIFFDYVQGDDLYNLIRNFNNNNNKSGKGGNKNKQNKKNKNSFSEEQTMYITKQIVSGITDLHLMGIAHRDIKPDNVIVNMDDMKATIIDFGFSCFISDEDYNFRSGTAGYKPPEYFEDVDYIDYKAGDIYSLGITLYELNSVEIFNFKTKPKETAHEMSERFHKLPNKLIEKNITNPHLKYIIRNCIKQDPTSRITAAEIFNYLNHAI